MSALGRVGICTDSTAELPVELIERFAVEVVPITVIIAGEEYLEGVDLWADDVAAHLASHPVPASAPVAPAASVDDGPGACHHNELRTSRPSPGQYALAYEHLLESGCTEILSVHGPTPGGPSSCSAARLAARHLDVPVRVVDTGALGFALGCCVWAAGDAVARGASIDEAASAAAAVGGSVAGLFIVDALGPPSGGGVSVFAASNGRGTPGEPEAVFEVETVLDAVNAIAGAVLGWGHDLIVGIGHADVAASSVADALASALGETAAVREVIRYRVGASSAARTGPGTVTCFAFAAPVTPSSATEPSTPTAS